MSSGAKSFSHETNSFADMCIEDLKTKICKDSKVVASELSGNNFLQDYSCFNRGLVRKYLAMGR